MNAGLIASYIIGGILIISIISMNNSVSNSASEITLSQSTREKLTNIAETIAGDIQKIGFNRTNKTSDMIKNALDHKIMFYSNIDNSTDNSVELITWELTKTPIASTANPDDYVLMRTVEDLSSGNVDKTSIELGVTNFKIAYYDDYGKPISDSLATPVSSTKIPDIKQLFIRIRIESSDKIYNGINGKGRYVPSVWEKRFSPPNLQSN